ncbi:alpha/beta fold hydrolase [Paracnuella aquatica]|uniref:alpha/beta fold hydrolase n=1 Tax=Paracnuella aquatica TaxID=2268757 RepID=UPI000DEF664F|nr:alpha/beta hydrolase [Paracnuella aquatica]RPD50539.1 alpha/beta hydrolase [Paracnuella aquatica]
MLETTCNISGVPLFYRTAGEGPAVVLLHGFGETGIIWNDQVSALSGYRLIVPDLPGSGQSAMIGDMSMEGLATAVHGLLQELGIERCVLIGHSMGGYIALAFLEKYGELLAGIGLFHSSAFADSEEKKGTRQKGIQFIEKHGAAAFLETATPNLYSPATKEERPELVSAHIESVKEASAAALIAYYRSMMQRPDRTALLQQNKIPVLFVLGKYDTAVPMADGLAQAHLPAVSHVHLLEHSGHMGMKEETERSNGLLQAFLTTIHH